MTPLQNLNLYLPYGESLRVFLEQPYVTPAELRIILRRRGVFLPDYDKPTAVPRLALATVTPSEFEILLVQQKHKEDTLKTSTTSLPWNSNATLQEAIPNIGSLEDHLKDQLTCKISKYSGVQCVEGNPDHIKMSFSIERTNLHRSWATDVTPHEGAIEIKKVSSGKEVFIEILSTIPESKNLCRSVLKKITTELKLNSHIPLHAAERKVLFNSFDNAQRVKFLLNFSDPESSELEFSAITDYDISPDNTKSLPDTIGPFLRKVRRLALRGDELQDSLLLRESEYHEFVLLSRIVVKFKFEYHGGKGTCVASFGFSGPAHSDMDTHEFETIVESIHVDADRREAADRSTVRRYVERSMRDLSSKKRQKFFATPESVDAEKESRVNGTKTETER